MSKGDATLPPFSAGESQAGPGGKTASFGKGSAFGNILTDCERLIRAPGSE
jgi:hypothetical protein